MQVQCDMASFKVPAHQIKGMIINFIEKSVEITPDFKTQILTKIRMDEQQQIEEKQNKKENIWDRLLEEDVRSSTTLTVVGRNP